MPKEVKYVVSLNDEEQGVVLRSLCDEQSDLKSRGISTDAVDDLIVKIGTTPPKKFRRKGVRCEAR